MAPQVPIVNNVVRQHTNPDAASTDSAISTAPTFRWQSVPSREVCVLYEDEPSETLRLYSVQDGYKRAEDDNSDIVVSRVQIIREGEYVVGDALDVALSEGGAISALCRLKNHFALCASCDGGGLQAALLPAPIPGTQADTSPLFRPLTGHRSIDATSIQDKHIGFCAASGRLVYLSRMGQLIVSDYLAPPLDDPGH